MEELSLLIEYMKMLSWAIGIGFTALGSLMLFLHMMMSKRMDKLDLRIDKLDEKLTDVDRRLCRIEGAMMNKECCILQHDHKDKAQ
jgi:hypothetical protein